MNENNNYFGDITELFLKAKKEENIDVNPHSKNAIREMVLHKAKPVPTVNIWQKWRYQFIGVPASLMALVVIVYAATNLNFSLPTEDFTPEVFDSVLQSEDIAEEAVVEEQEPGESDNAFLWVIPSDQTNSQELRTPRTLNKVLSQTVEELDSGAVPTPAVESTPAEKASTEEESTLDFGIFDDTMNLVVPIKDELAEEPATEAPAKTPTTGGSTPLATDPKAEFTDPVSEEPSDKSVQPNGEPQTESINENALISPVTTTDMLSSSLTYQENISLREEYAEKENIFERQETTDAYTTYYYSNVYLQEKPAFGDELLAKITVSGEPTAVTVYYISDTEVVVEVAYEDTSKWYLFGKIADQWTIQKYEKKLLKDVVK